MPLTEGASGLIGAGLQVGGQLLSGALDRKFALNQAQWAHAMELEHWHRQNERDDFLWNRQNEYMDPSSQMARLKAAGLNPHLIYGTSPSSAVGQPGTPQKSTFGGAKPAKAVFPNPFAGMADFGFKQVQSDNVAAATEVAKKQALYYNAQATHEWSKMAKTDEEVKLAQSVFKSSVDAMKYDADKKKHEVRIAENNARISDETVQEKIDIVEENLRLARLRGDTQYYESVIKRETAWLIENGIRPEDAFWYRIFKEYEDDNWIQDRIREFGELWDDMWGSPLTDPSRIKKPTKRY